MIHGRKRLALRKGVVLAGMAGLGFAGSAAAATYTYTPTNAASDLWSANTNWSGSVSTGSAVDTRLTFVGTNSTVFASGLANTNTNNIPGAYQLNILDLQGTGPTSATATINLNSSGSSTGLNLIANGGVNPTISLNALVGGGTTPALIYNVNQAILLSNDLTFQGNGTAGFVFAGAISGSAAVTKTGSSTLTLTGANTFTGGFTLTSSSVRVGVNSVGTPGSITSGAFGTGTILLNGGNIVDADLTARTILNPVTVAADATLGSSTTNFTGNLTFNGDFTLSGASRTLNINNTITITGAIGDGGNNYALTKALTGTLVLSGTNTYTGGTTISAGVAQFNSAGAVAGSGANVVVGLAGTASSGGTLGADTLLGRITTTSTGTLGLAANSAVNLDFTSYPNLYFGASTSSAYTGTITPAGGTYKLGGGGAGLTLSNTNALTGTNNLVLNPNTGGTVTLSGANDFAGTITVSNLTNLRLGNNNSIANATTITVNGNGTNAGSIQLLAGVTISGKTVTINGTTGQGTIQTLATGTATSTWAGPVILGSDGARFGTATGANGILIISGPISSPGGAFAPAIRADNTPGSTVRFASANSYTGANTQIVVGVLQLGAAGALPSTTGLTMGNAANQGFATLDLNGNSSTISTLATIASDNIATTVTNTSATAAVLAINSATSSTYGNASRGLITGNLALSKAGAGTLTLFGPGSNTFTGGTTITGGTLAAQINGVLGTGDVSVSPSGANTTLDLSAAGLTSAGSGAVSNAATLSLSSGGGFFGRVAFGASTLNETVNVLVVDGVPQPAGIYSASTPGFSNFITGSGTITSLSVPEPASVGVLGCVAIGLLARRRRKC